MDTYLCPAAVRVFGGGQRAPVLASCFEIRIGAFADLELAQALAGDFQCLGEISDPDAQFLALVAQ